MDSPAIVSSIAEVNDSAAAKARFDEVTKAFEKAYGCKPEYYARAPGRVNLIGEHIDYSGYAVLPMAIQQDHLMAVKIVPEGEKVHLQNVNTKYEPREYNAAKIDIDNSKHDWGNYFLCGYKGIIEDGKLEKPVGLQIMLDGNVPTAAGLSSSSALVVCAAVAAAHGNKLKYTKTQLATICMKSERWVGTEGGGMDQSISLLAEKGTAKFIEFNPIRASDVPLPKGGVFVIANSLVGAHKYVSAGSCYNKRVVECRLAARIIAKECNINLTPDLRTLGNLQNELAASLPQMCDTVKDKLHSGSYTKDEMAKILEISVEVLEKDWMSPSTVSQTEFNLRDRALHVYSEADRVIQFRSAEGLEALGKLMSESHTSCSQLYECSCPELDTLTELCRKSGAYGSRLTGAGWGGCTVSLVAEDKVDDFLKAIRKGYYEADPERLKAVDSSLFATGAAPGAAIVQS